MPSLQTDDDNEALFEHLRDGALSVVSTDHVAQTRERKEDTEWWEGPFGANGLQASLLVFQDEAVNKREFSYPSGSDDVYEPNTDLRIRREENT